MISVSEATQNALDAGNGIHFSWLAMIGEYRWTTNAGDINHDGHTWLANGFIASIPKMIRQRELKAHSISIGLVVAEPSVLTTFLDQNPVGLPVELSQAIMDEQSGQPLEVITQFIGVVDSVAYSETDKISLKIQAPLAQPNRMAGRLMTTRDQQRFSSGDEFFKFAHIVNDNLPWGGKK